MSEEKPIYDDLIWEYVLVSKLQPYIPIIKRWWDNYEHFKVISTGVFPLEDPDPDAPPGMFVRMTNTPARSPIKGVQAFPFVPSAYLQITGIPGGANRMIERVCAKGLEIEGFVIVEKHNLPSTYHSGQILCILPKDVVNGRETLGKFTYLTLAECMSIAEGVLPTSVIVKCKQYIK